ncbi:NAD(P)/FAD-dependent oxidoreductase [Gemmatimonadota bacterium]
MTDSSTVDIIGAGLAGLMAARTLRGRGWGVKLFDKGRRPGGRANTREHRSYRFDHGAQFFTVREPAIQREADSWIDEGLVEEWPGSLVRIEGDRIMPAKDSVRYVGVPGMVSLAEYLARDLDIETGCQVREVRPDQEGWAFFDSSNSLLGAFDLALIAVPAPQAVRLLSAAPMLQAKAKAVRMAPCWAGMYVFEERLELGFDGAFMAGTGLSWIARNNSKPGRPEPEAWVLHAGAGWTGTHWELERGRAAEALLEELVARFGPLPRATFQRAHRWAYAQASEPVPDGALFDPDLGVGACGDWCRGGRIEGALLSGLLTADQIIRKTNQ